MKRMKQILVFLAGMMVFLCATPVFADEATIVIPYAVDEGGGGDWWSGLAISNTGGVYVMTVKIYSAYGNYSSEHHRYKYSRKLVGTVSLDQYHTETRLLRDFFTEQPYPTPADGVKNGRAILFLEANGGNAKALRATLFVGNTGADGGFSYQVFEPKD